MERWRERIDGILNDDDSTASHIYSIFLAFSVVMVCAIFVVLTYPIPPTLSIALHRIENLITATFVIDYLLRFWVNKFSIRYLFTPLALIDLIAILPAILPVTHLQFFRVLRLFRILRLLRVMRRGKILGWRITDLQLQGIRIFYTLFCIVFISSGLIFDVESWGGSTEYETFFDAFYFSVVSLSTVGYGDITPATFGGRVATLLMIGSGGLLIPWQITKLVRHFFEGRYKIRKQCKSCDLAVHDIDANFCKLCGNQIRGS